jgi:TonB-dependent receptor
MKLKLLLITLFICSLGWSQSKGTISGVILDKDLNNEPLAFANVTLKGTTIGTSTDVEGKYAIVADAGNYTLVISFLGYETVEIQCAIKENEILIINKIVGSGSVSLNDVVVKSTVNREKETALLLEQKNAVVIKQSIGAQELARKGVSDVEEGLTKITGITKVGARGLFVRGLEDRYNNLLINDLAAPTNNPFKKIIPLDLFSTDIVGVIEVYKTFNPNIYGDFAGGTFNIQTSKGSKSVTKLNIGMGYTDNATLRDFSISKDANSTKGFFGLTGNDRDLPNFLGKTATGQTINNAQSLVSFKKSGFDVDRVKAPLNSSIGILHSEKFDLKNEKNFSYLISVNAENNYSFRNGVERNFRPDLSGYVYQNDFDNTEYRYKTSLTSLLGLNYSTKKLKLGFNTLFIKTTENLIKDQFGIANSTSSTNKTLIRTNQLDESNYLNNQLNAEYALNEDKSQTLKAAASYAITKYAQPDRKFFSGTLTDGKILSTIGANNFIKQYLEINGDSYFSSLVEYNLKFGGAEKNNKLTIGYNGNSSEMKSSYRFVAPASNSAPNIDAPLNSVDAQLNSYLSDGLFNFRESSNATYQAQLKESANAGYANLFYKFNEKWEINGGLRLEKTARTTQYRVQGSFNDPFKSLVYDNLYILPALNLKYGMNEKSNLRFSSTKTYTRPVVMEAYPIEYINADGTSIRGNPFLENSDNYNVDLKYEFFPTSKETFAVGIFGKKINNPIERTFIANAANSIITTYLNSDNATLFGAEIEFILDLGRINKKLSDFSLGFNTSLMDTKVAVRDLTKNPDGSETISIETHKSRNLQGASKWLINSDLKYQFDFNKNWTNTASLVYSVFGKRIYAIGTNGLDHIYENPINQLDFVWSSKVSKHIDLRFSADNLLDPRRQTIQGSNGNATLNADPLIGEYRRGRGFSLSLGYTF